MLLMSVSFRFIIVLKSVKIIKSERELTEESEKHTHTHVPTHMRAHACRCIHEHGFTEEGCRDWKRKTAITTELESLEVPAFSWSSVVPAPV